jgi:hypothetical protein
MTSRDLTTLLIGLVVLLLGFVTYHPPYVGYATKECLDSDGQDYFFKGMVTTSDGFSATDACADSLLQEFFCEDGLLQFRFHTCSGGCEDGVCLEDTRTSFTQRLEGDEFLFGSGSDQLEINEELGDVHESLTESDLDILAGGIVSTQEGTTEFHQYLRFNNDITTGKIQFGEDERDFIGDFFYVKEGDHIFEYELEFESGLETSVSGTSLDDFIDQKIMMLGVEYSIVGATKNGDTVTLRLVGGDYSDLVYEHETKTYHVAGKNHQIEVMTIDDVQKEVTLNVDGTMTSQLEEGDVTYFGSFVVGVGDIFIQEALEGRDAVELYVGGRSLEFKDDTSDSSFSTSFEVNGNSISEAEVRIKGQTISDGFEISSFTYRLRADARQGGDVYVPPGFGVREYLDEPEGMLANWDIHYEGLNHQGTSTLIFDPVGNDEYDVTFENIKGNLYSVGLVENVGGSLTISSHGDSVHFIEGSSTTDFLIDQTDYVVLTNDNDRTGVTNIVRYDSIDTTEKSLHFDDLAEGDKTVPYTGAEGIDAIGDIILSGHTYRVHVGGAPEYRIVIDMDNDGDIDGGETNIVIKGGGILDLGSTLTPGGNFDMTLTTEASQFDESSSDETLTLTMQDNSGEVDISLPAQSSLSIETDKSVTKALSDYGVYLEKDSDDPDRLIITYPLSQSLGDVRLVFSSSTSEIVSSDFSGDCGNSYCDVDEGYENCPADCDFVEFSVEQPSLPPPVVAPLCGDGVCEEGEDEFACSVDCLVVEQPSVILEKQGWFARFLNWFRDLFS